MEEIDVYRILMDERWELEDLYTFPYTYSQVHAFIYNLDFELDDNKEKRIDYSLMTYPWRGGYSYTNIYRVLNNLIPDEEKPKISEIKYASPGWIELLMNPDVALKIAAAMVTLVGTGAGGMEAFKRIDRARLDIAKRRRLHDVEMVKLSAQEAKHLNEMSEEIAKNIGFTSLTKLNQRTKNPEVTLKLLLAHQRRMNKLAVFVASGKAELPIKTHKKANNTP